MLIPASSRTTLAASLAALLAAAGTPAAVRAQDAAPDSAAGVAAACPALAAPARTWPAPLDRAVTGTGAPLALREQLERLTTATGIRFSYDPELVPLERAACLPAERLPLGGALARLLAGTGLAPVVAGGDQVVLAPVQGQAAAASAIPEYAHETGRLDRVVVTGTASGGPERAAPFALTVLDREQLDRAPGSASLAQLLDGQAPGIWLWNESPAAPLARYGSVRGASSFGVSSPKVYLDGIELANPLLLTTLDPARVQSVEIIRGPQGAALYGADAISGVINITSRQEGTTDGSAALDLRTSGGATASAFAASPVVRQDHALTLRTGSDARSATLGLGVTTLGAYVPGASSRQLTLHGSARRVSARAIVSGTAQLFTADAWEPTSPLLAGVYGGPAPRAGRERVRHYTVGSTATLLGDEHWTHVIVAGIDGYRLAGVSSESLPIPSASDSALRAARGDANRLTLRASSTRRSGSPDTRSSTLTLGVEHSTARESTNGAGTLLVPREGGSYDRGSYDRSGGSSGPGGGASEWAPEYDRAPVAATSWWSNTGILAQERLDWRNSAFLTVGGRGEYITGPANSSQVAFLPMLGGALVREHGALAVKLRAAYGKGIRPARTVARGATWSGGRVAGSLLALNPERQEGVEAGVDLFWGNRASLRVTRFDQRAADLVQPVSMLDSSSSGNSGPGGGHERYVSYQLQNVGAIDNRGWELQAGTATGPLTVQATLSLVSSRVHGLAAGYRGDLRPGDRMLEVPARTLGLDATWRARRWSASATLARASDWINYDRLALAAAAQAALSSGTPAAVPVGGALRDYWVRYAGVTRLGSRLTIELGRHSSLLLAGENLFDRQLGEPDNASVVPGRSVTIGLRAGF